MASTRQTDEPSPTIVGPRPAEGAGGKLSVPRGMERLLIIAAVNPDWREKILAGPLVAAAEAAIELSASERAILGAIPRAALEQMADAFVSRHGRPVLGKAAAGVAAAALLATGLAGCGDDMSAGCRSDVPRPRAGQAAAPLLATEPLQPPERFPVIGALAKEPPAKEAPAIQWQASPDAALAEAKKAGRAVMAVFPIPREKLPAPDPNRGISVEEASQTVCSSDSKEFRLAVKGANVLAVRVAKPAVPIGGAEWSKEQRDKHNGSVKAYEAALKKYRLDGDGKLPAVVFLAPDGSELSRLARPTEEAKLIEAVKAVPGQLAKWKAAQEKPADRE